MQKKEFSIVFLFGLSCLFFSSVLLHAAPGDIGRISQESGASVAPGVIAEKLPWLDSLDNALGIAQEEYRPVVVFFHSPTCGWCARMRAQVFADEAVKAQLQHFVRVEVTVEDHPEEARKYMVQNIPAVRILAADGRMLQMKDGFVGPPEMLRMLRGSLNAEFLKQSDPDFQKLVGQLEDNEIKTEQWPDVMRGLGQNEKRVTLRKLILELDPFPRAEFIRLLSHSQLSVRLGALEILEELAGANFSYEPWSAAIKSPENIVAIERWEKWGEQSGDSKIEQVYSVLSEKEVDGYIRDMIGSNRERAVRARSALRHGGDNVARSLRAYLDRESSGDDPALRVARDRVRELFYAMTMPPLGNSDPDTLSHRLISGNLDSKLETLTKLKESGRAALPILTDFLTNKDPLIRETAIDAILNAGRSFSIGLVTEHLQSESDNAVVMAALRTIGVSTLSEGEGILSEYAGSEEEDLAVMALESLGAIRASDSNEKIVEQLSDERWRVRVAALETIGKLKGSRFSFSSRSSASRNKSGFNDSVRSLLKDEDEFVRVAAVETIAKLGDRDAKDDLLALYEVQEEARGPVIHALLKMKESLPSTLRDDLANSEADSLLSVIDTVGQVGKKQLGIISDFADHEDLDVSCATLRILASEGMQSDEYQRIVLGALREKQPQKVAAVIESLSFELAQYEAYSADGPKTDYVIPESPIVEEIFEVFLNKKKKARDGLPDDADPLKALFDEVRLRLGGTGSETTDALAALIMAKASYQPAIEKVIERLPTQTESQRNRIANRLNNSPISTIPILQTLLRDKSDTVRAGAAETLLYNDNETVFFETVLSELVRPGARLRAWDIDLDYLDNPMKERKGKTVGGDFAREVLQESENEALKTLAIVILRHAWKIGDEEVLQPFTTDESPWLRRAAWYAIGRNNINFFSANVAKIAADPSEKVRAVIPYILDKEGRYFVHYFSSEKNQRFYDYESSSNRALGKDVIDILKKLTSDSGASVRVDSAFLLMSQGEQPDAAELQSTLSSFPDRESIRSRVSDYLEENYQKLDKSYRFLTDHIDEREISDSTVEKIYSHFGVDPGGDEVGDIAWVERKDGGAVDPPPPLAMESGEIGSDVLREAQQVELHFFHNPGCDECKDVETYLEEIGAGIPYLEIVRHNILESDAALLSEALGERFDVPQNVRMVAPAIFTGDGYLIKDDIKPVELGKLIAKSSSSENSAPGWAAVGAEALSGAGQAIESRYTSLGLAVILSAGFLDGINPCAFATIILFLSYLQIARQGPRQILMVGLAFILGVFLTYFVLGLGLVEIASRLQMFAVAGLVLNVCLALFSLVIMVLSFRDGILCMQGRLAETTLQLPVFLKERIREVARTGARHRRFVLAAFISGVVISVLELACTGQVYLPTIQYMIQSGKASAWFYLVLYNIAFVLPLLAVFILAYFGLRSESLIAIQRKHSAVIKFATALLFLALFVLLLREIS